MAARQKIPYQTTSVVELTAPTDTIAQEPLDNTDDGATCTFKVYDPAKDEAIAIDEASSQSILSVTDPAVFVVGDTAEVTQNDGTIHAAAISDVIPEDGTITLDDPLTVAADAGNRVRARLGDEITMTEFGTPALETLDWGFRGALASNHAGLDLDLEINIEISFVGDPGGGLDLLDLICGVIKPNCECVEQWRAKSSDAIAARSA